MFVRNAQNLPSRKFKKSIGQYLTKKGIPYISIFYESGIYVFTNTQKLNDVLKSSPAWIKVLLMIGGEVRETKV